MKLCIVGAGAIGGYLATVLARAGHEVVVVARGATYAAIRERGLVVHTAAGSIATRDFVAVDRIHKAGVCEAIVLAMKANQVAPIAEEVNAIMDENTLLVPMQNGIPWWYFHRHGGALAGTALASVDPGGAIAAALDAQRVIGCVVYPAATVVEPGVIHHVEGNRFTLGELDGSISERVTRLASVFQSAGLKAPVIADIRDEIWLKLWGNLSFNPISALTHSTLVDLCRFPLSRELAATMMREAQAVAGALGATFRVPLEQRIAGAEKVGKHKTSMLQDVEAGRDPEVDALIGAVVELGTLVGVPTPSISAVYALVKLLSKTMTEDRLCVRATPPASAAMPLADSTPRKACA